MFCPFLVFASNHRGAGKSRQHDLRNKLCIDYVRPCDRIGEAGLFKRAPAFGSAPDRRDSRRPFLYRFLDDKSTERPYYRPRNEMSKNEKPIIRNPRPEKVRVETVSLLLSQSVLVLFVISFHTPVRYCCALSPVCCSPVEQLCRWPSRRSLRNRRNWPILSIGIAIQLLIK